VINFRGWKAILLRDSIQEFDLEGRSWQETCPFLLIVFSHAKKCMEEKTKPGANDKADRTP